MGKNRILFLALFSLLISFGCSSPEKKAAELMENGSFDEANEAYENRLKDDPKNTDAQGGLLSARYKVIDTHLINVRKSRMAGSSTNLALMDILFLENKWKIEPRGPVAFTQREEMDFATDSILKELKNSKFTRLPLLSCLRLESSAKPQKFVEEWHQKFLGLNVGDATNLLKSAN